MIDTLPLEIIVQIIDIVIGNRPKWNTVFPLMTLSTMFENAIRYVCEHNWKIVIPQKMVLVHLTNNEPRRVPVRRIWVDENIQLWQSLFIALNPRLMEGSRRSLFQIYFEANNETFTFFEKSDEIPPVRFTTFFNINTDTQTPTLLTYRYLRKSIASENQTHQILTDLKYTTLFTISRPHCYLFLKK